MTFPNLMTHQWSVHPVNRQEQVKEFRSALDRIRVYGSIFQTLHEWYGGPGIGKSTLIRLLVSECHDARIPYAAVDFNSTRHPRAAEYSADLASLMEDLLENLGNEADQVRQTITEYRQIAFESEEEKRLGLNTMSRAFVRLIGELTEDQPVALLFDETERADQSVADWLEERIIGPLVQNGRCLIVWTGRRPQRWKRFEIRRRLRSQELGTWDRQSTADLFERNSQYPLSDLTMPVHRITQGHPFADTIVLRYLDTMAKSGETPKPEQFDRIEPDLRDGLVQEFVEKFAFNGLDEEIVNACRVLALVRQFDVIMLREILKETVYSFESYEREEFGKVLSRLRATQLVLWDDKRKGYALDPTLRHILGEHIRRHQPNLYAQVSRVALRVYRDWIERAGDNRGVYIVEEIYQQACLNLVPDVLSPEERIELRKLLEQRLREYHQRDPDLRASAIDRLYHELEDDPDLPGLVTKANFEVLLEFVRDARVGGLNDS